jgi:hypothetical protein
MGASRETASASVHLELADVAVVQFPVEMRAKYG